MRPLTPRQIGALHRMIDLAAKQRPLAPTIAEIEAFELTMKIAKKAMQQVHIQQVYFTKQRETS